MCKVFIVSVTVYYLTVVPCSDTRLINFVLSFLTHGLEAIYETVYMLPKPIKWWNRDALAVDTDMCVEVEASLW